MGKTPAVSRRDVTRLWLHRQGLGAPRETSISKKALVVHLEGTGGLQLDSVNVLDRAHHLMGFRYRIEVYTPAAKREFGYYAMPILHEGRFAGRIDPKLHMDRGLLEIRAIRLEPGFRRDRAFDAAFGDALADLARFAGAKSIELPPAGGK